MRRFFVNILIFSFCVIFIKCCQPDVKFKGDHHRRKELDDKLVNNLVELKEHEEVLLKAVDALKKANKNNKENQKDYEERIAEIEKELKETKNDHARLLEKHENYIRNIEKPKTWGETISKMTGDAFGRLFYNILCGSLVVLIPLIIRPFQRRWLNNIRNRNGPTIEEVSDDDEESLRIDANEVQQILNSENKKKSGKRKMLKAE